MTSTEKGKEKKRKSPSDYMLDARDGQEMMDLEAWGPKLASFMERQPEVKGPVDGKNAGSGDQGVKGGCLEKDGL